MTRCSRCHDRYSGDACPCGGWTETRSAAELPQAPPGDAFQAPYNPALDPRRCPECGGMRMSAGSRCRCGYYPVPIPGSTALSSLVSPPPRLPVSTTGREAQRQLQDHPGDAYLQCAACGAQATQADARQLGWGQIGPMAAVDALTRDYCSPICGQRLYGALRAIHDANHGRRLGRHYA